MKRQMKTSRKHLQVPVLLHCGSTADMMQTSCSASVFAQAVALQILLLAISLGEVAEVCLSVNSCSPLGAVEEAVGL